MNVKMLHVDELEDLGLPHNDKIVVSDTEIEKHRWYTLRELIFQDEQDSLFWRIEYEDPATEMQEDQGYWGYLDQVEATQVKLVPISAMVWKEA